MEALGFGVIDGEPTFGDHPDDDATTARIGRGVLLACIRPKVTDRHLQQRFFAAWFNRDDGSFYANVFVGRVLGLGNETDSGLEIEQLALT